MEKLNIETFIKRANEKHNHKFDYSRAVYINSSTKVEIICPVHGSFLQKPNDHLRGVGCAACSGIRRLTTEEFIRRSKEHYPDYDYSNSVYVNNLTKVIVRCPTHGEFLTNPKDHYSGKSGCPKCKRSNIGQLTRSDLTKFVNKAITLHGNVYDYSSFEYLGSKAKSTIKCNIHGDFLMAPNNHLVGQGCPKCGIEKRRKSSAVDYEEFIIRANEKHNSRFLYETTNWENLDSEVYVTCPEHGKFLTTGNLHLRTHGCPQCAMEIGAQRLVVPKEKFLELAYEKYGDKYSYENLDYQGMVEPGSITCKEHGDWTANLSRFIHMGIECPECTGAGRSRFEKELVNYISTLVPDQVLVNSHPDFMGKNELDIFIPSRNFAIEFNGSYWHSSLFKPRDHAFKKWKSCKDNNVTLLTIWEHYWVLPDKRKVYESKIRHYLGLDRKIFARKTTLKEIDNQEAILFHKENHLEGFEISYKNLKSIALTGEDNEVLMVLSYGELYSQTHKKMEQKIQRISTRLDVTVVGGITKLTKYLERLSIKPVFQVTLDTGGSVPNLDLSNVSFRYWWIKNNKFLTRNSTQVKDLKFKSDWVEGDTERTYMERNGYYQVFDTGIVSVNY